MLLEASFLSEDIHPTVGEFVELTLDKLYALINGLSGMAWVASSDMHSFWFNKRWYEYSGARPHDMKDWAWQDYFHPQEIGKVAGEFCSAISTGKAWEEVVSLRRFDGTYRWFLSHATPVCDADLTIKYWIGSYVDIHDYVDPAVCAARRSPASANSPAKREKTRQSA